MTSAQAVLVTGAGGFVCRFVVTALLEMGAKVIGIDRRLDEPLQQIWTHWGDRLKLVECDVVDMPSFAVDAVVHGAAVTAGPEDTGQSPEENFRTNLEPTLAALEWAAAHGARRFVFLSSSAVFRETPPGTVVETMAASPLGLYAVAKQAAENLIETLRVVYGRDAVVVRLSNIYGPGERARPTRPRMSGVGSMVQTALETGHLVVYRDDPARDWTFAPDVGRAICRLLVKPVLAHHLYHVASGQTFTPMEIAAVIQSLLPAVRLDLRDGTDPNTMPLTRRGTLSAERLRQDTGFVDWTPFLEGLRQVIDWEHRLEQVH
jgi:nucleoside-diphosphate-sugar epimerase